MPSFDGVPYIVIIEGYVEHDSTGGHAFRTTDLYFATDDENVLQQIRSRIIAQRENQRHGPYPAYSYNAIEIHCVNKTRGVQVNISDLLEV